MRRRAVVGGLCSLSLAGCLRLQGESGGDAETEGSPPTDSSDGVIPVDGSTTSPQRVVVDELQLERVRDLSVTLYGSVFEREGSFFGVTDDGLGAVAPDGTLRWESDPVGEEFFPALSQSIAFASGTVFAGCNNDDRNAARLYAFDEATGEQRWVHDTDSENFLVSGVVADDRSVFYTSMQLGSDTNPIVTALDHEGNTLWSFSPQFDPIEALILHDDRLYLSGGRLYAMDRDDPDSLEEQSAPVGGPLTRFGDAAFSNSVARVNLRDASLEWETDVWGEYGSPIRPRVDSDLVVTGTDAGYVVAVAAESGEIRWETRVDGPVLEVTPTDDYVFVADRNGDFYVLERSDGTVLHQRSVRDEQGVSIHVATTGTELIFDNDRTVYELVDS